MKKVASITLKFGIPAVVLVLTMQVTYKSARAQKYSDWSEPINLGPIINSAVNDFSPAISKDGLSLYFTSTNRPDGFGGDDIYVSQRASSNDPWGPPVNLGPTINTSSSERDPAFSRDGHLMFFATTRTGGFGGFDIWVSRRVHTNDDFGWQAPENLGAGVNSTVRDDGPSYFANEEVGTPQLYFSSNRLGVFNTHVSEQATDGSFGPALLILELGETLGSSTSPSIRHDGLEIFINSNRPGSLGNSNDLWVSTRESVFDAWSEPVNLGPTVNSTVGDLSPDISSDRETLFFFSTRPGTFGQADLYMSTRTKLSEK